MYFLGANIQYCYYQFGLLCCVLLRSCCCVVTAVAVVYMCRCVCDIHMCVVQCIIVKVCSVVALSPLQTLHYRHNGSLYCCMLLLLLHCSRCLLVACFSGQKHLVLEEFSPSSIAEGVIVLGFHRHATLFI